MLPSMAYDAQRSATDDEGRAGDATLILSDDDFLAVLADERANSVGLDADETLSDNRERALNYINGLMPDLPALPNRSQAVSTDVSDAIETIMPDLMEIFTGGEDVVTFRPQGEEDVEAAAQETDYVNHVFFNENPGWLTLETAFRDGLSVKLGVVKVYGETYEEAEEERFEGVGQTQLQLMAEGFEADGAEIADLTATEPDPETGEARFDFTLKRTRQWGKACVDAVPPEDFAVAKDTVILAKTTYCAMRSRPRAQDLIADGYDEVLVSELQPYGREDTDGLEQARDTAGEHEDGEVGVTSTDFNLHQVEIIEHYLRIDADGDGKPELWCIVTGNDETVLLKKERADRIPFAVGSPYRVAHRLIGRSLFDLLGEIQKIRTALVRMMLDSGYFAMNQRYEVAMDRVSMSTIADLLNNIPGAPVRSKSGDAVRPLTAGSLNFDVAGAIEMAAVMGEQRSGVVRNAQGLNPDTLHETKGGMEKLFNAAQKRIRMVARVLAETFVKDMFLLLHQAIRTHVPQAATVRLRNKWVQIAPTEWGVRNDMTVEVGVGSGGKEMELAGLSMVAGWMEKIVEAQGGFDGPIVKLQQVYNLAKRGAELTGARDPNRYFLEPPAEEPNAPKPEPPPDPDVVKAQMEDAREREKMEREFQLRERELALEDQRQREQAAAELQLRRDQLLMEARLQAVGVGAETSPVRFGGEPG